jgi:coenzyme F420 hydrogenase subunit delta
MQVEITMSEETLPEYLNKRVLILGVGNVLFGDDGFGSAVTQYLLENCRVPDDVYIMDVGIGAGDVLFTLSLSQKKPKKVIILDAVDLKRKSGEIFELSIDDLPASNLGSYSFHLFPTPDFLKELTNQGVQLVIIACQAERMPDTVNPGLSDSVQSALPRAAEKALELARNNS